MDDAQGAGARGMKAAPFTYRRAEALEEALDLLARHGSDCRPIAGGQSLVPMMAMRLVRPTLLVDINRLAELKSWQARPGLAATGATLRQRDAEEDAELLRAVPLLGEALRWVGHTQTRNRGTLGGSLAHADPSAELPLVAAMLDAAIVLRSAARGERRVPGGRFFLAAMTTEIAEDECLVAVEWPVWPGRTGCAFEEVAIRHGDFAMASAACQVELDEAGTTRRAALGLGGVAATPLAFPDLAAGLLGRRLTPGLAREVAEEAARRAEPGGDTHADAEYRRHLAAVLLRRALLRAAGSAAPRLAA